MQESPKNDNYDNFRTTIDGHGIETAFAGAIHDFYHAMREMAMSENVAKARFRLAAIAKKHPNNKVNETTIDSILIDGELIHSYELAVDTMFALRPNYAQRFGEIFYTSNIHPLHADLKNAFIQDMAENQKLWQNEYGINKSDLRSEDQLIYDKLVEPQNQKVGNFSLANLLNKFGLAATPNKKQCISNDSSSNDNMMRLG